MNNKIVYFDENFPSYYLNGSRDFQLFARLLTLILNSAKVEADSLLYLNDAILIADRLLPLLQTKVGFWTRKEFTNDQLRFVCDAFDLLMRKKGSRDGIVQAVQLFIKTLGISTNFDVLITNKDNEGNDVYNIDIGIDSHCKDSTLMYELLSYIVPTGYTYNVFYYSEGKFEDKSLLYGDFVLLSSATNLQSSQIRSAYYTSTTGDWTYDGWKNIETTGPTQDESYVSADETIQSIDMTTIYKAPEE